MAEPLVSNPPIPDSPSQRPPAGTDPSPKVSKRLVVCCDGTWQSLRNAHLTNISKLATAIKLDTPGPQGQRIPQIVYYDDGLGTRNRLERLLGGATGWGLDHAVEQAYRFLCLNWEPDDEIYLFGFSRGAYTVRSLAGLLYNCDLLLRENIDEIPAAIELYRDARRHPRGETSACFRKAKSWEGITGQRVLVTALCCFDTVGARGIPDLLPHLPIDKLFNRRHQFHNPQISPIIYRAFHACALDEHRATFPITPMEEHHTKPNQLRQMWFAGDHGCVGGGHPDQDPLAVISLNWMLDEMETAGLSLEVDRKKLASLSPAEDSLHPYPRNTGLLVRLKSAPRNEGPGASIHHTATARYVKHPRPQPPRSIPTGATILGTALLLLLTLSLFTALSGLLLGVAAGTFHHITSFAFGR